MTPPRRARRLLLAAAFGAGIACAAPGVAPSSASAPGGERAPLIVVGDEDYPPYLFRDEDGHATGLVADEWALWSARTGVRVSLQPMSWTEAQRQIADGRADVIDTVFRSPARERELDFGPPYADIPATIYASSELGAVVDAGSLRPLRVGALAGDVCVDRLREAGVAAIDTYSSYQAVIEAALAKGPKVFCMDAPVARYLLLRSDLAGRFRQAFVLFHGQIHRAVRRGDTQTLALMQQGFEAISPREYRALEEKWLGEQPAGLPWPRALRIAALALAFMVVATVLWGLALRRAVREKTALIDGERARLRTLINTSPDLIWFKDARGEFLACNKRFEQFIGAPEARLLGRTERDFLAPEVAAELADIDRRAVAAGHPLPHRFTLTYASDGHQEFVESLHTPVLGASGELSGVLSVARDVTQRRDDERHLRRLNRLYLVLTNVHAAIAREHDRESLFAAVCRIMVDDGGLRMAWVGWPDEASGELRPIASAGVTGTYLDPPHATLAAGPLGCAPSATAFREGRPAHSTDIGRDPAMAAWRVGALALGYCSSSAFPLKVRGRTVGVITMYSGTVEFFDAGELALLERLSVDIGQALEAHDLDAERERAVSALRDSEARFATIFKTNPVGLGLARYDDKRYIDVNDAFLALFGYALDECVGKNGLELGTWVDVDDRAQAMELLARDGAVRDFEARFRKRDGDVFHASFSAARISIGRQDLVIASYFDLTAQRLATRTLEERKLELERIVSQRTAELSNILDA
ncbi:MAG TPA: PAS domain S-box protein, partial [Burkholderiaceae bacterium]